MPNIEVSAPQHAFLTSDKKYSAFVAGYGAGKTFIGCATLLKHLCESPLVNTGYFAPTYTDIRDIFYPTIEEVAALFGFDLEIKVGNKEVNAYCGGQYRGTIICRSMNQPGSIVGFKIGRALIDELDTMSMDKAETAWRKIAARLRYNEKGLHNAIDLTTTPEGFRFTYKRFVAEKTESYGIVHASTRSNMKNLPEDYYRTLVETYPENVRAAYLEGLFVNMTSGSVYKSYDRKEQDTREELKGGEPIYVGQDFNVCNMTSAICIRRQDSFHCIDRLVGVYDTPELIRILKERFAGRQINLYPDASGGSRHTTNASASDLSLLRQAGIMVRVNPRNPAVRDRILSVNKAFESGRLYISTTRAKEIAEALEKQAYDKNGEPDKSSGYDHAVDAIGYLVAYEMPVIKPIVHTGMRMPM